MSILNEFGNLARNLYEAWQGEKGSSGCKCRRTKFDNNTGHNLIRQC